MNVRVVSGDPVSVTHKRGVFHAETRAFLHLNTDVSRPTSNVKLKDTCIVTETIDELLVFIRRLAGRCAIDNTIGLQTDDKDVDGCQKMRTHRRWVRTLRSLKPLRNCSVNSARHDGG
jgi:hypothetical protein